MAASNNNRTITYNDNYVNNVSFYFSRNKTFTLSTPETSTVIKKNELKLSSNAIKTISKIKSFSELTYNWDSYEAEQPSEVSIQESILFVKKLNKYSIPVYFVAPNPNGSILVELKNGLKSIEFFFFDDKRIEYALFKDDECEEDELLALPEDFHRIVAWLNMPIIN